MREKEAGPLDFVRNLMKKDKDKSLHPEQEAADKSQGKLKYVLSMLKKLGFAMVKEKEIYKGSYDRGKHTFKVGYSPEYPIIAFQIDDGKSVKIPCKDEAEAKIAYNALSKQIQARLMLDSLKDLCGSSEYRQGKAYASVKNDKGDSYSFEYDSFKRRVKITVNKVTFNYKVKNDQDIVEFEKWVHENATPEHIKKPKMDSLDQGILELFQAWGFEVKAAEPNKKDRDKLVANAGFNNAEEGVRANCAMYLLEDNTREIRITVSKDNVEKYPYNDDETGKRAAVQARNSMYLSVMSQVLGRKFPEEDIHSNGKVLSTDNVAHENVTYNFTYNPNKGALSYTSSNVKGPQSIPIKSVQDILGIEDKYLGEEKSPDSEDSANNKKEESVPVSGPYYVKKMSTLAKGIHESMVKPRQVFVNGRTTQQLSGLCSKPLRMIVKSLNEYAGKNIPEEEMFIIKGLSALTYEVLAGFNTIARSKKVYNTKGVAPHQNNREYRDRFLYLAKYISDNMPKESEKDSLNKATSLYLQGFAQSVRGAKGSLDKRATKANANDKMVMVGLSSLLTPLAKAFDDAANTDKPEQSENEQDMPT
jgi:hypothetical protein